MLVIPAGLFGTLMIVDYPGPPGPVGFAEFFGWWAVCVAVGLGSGRLLARSHPGLVPRLLARLAAIALQILFLLLLWADIQPGTPRAIKAGVEYSLQAIGIVAIITLVAFVGWVAVTSRRRREGT